MNQLLIRPYTPTDKTPCLEAFKSNVPKFFTQSEIQDFSNFLDKFQNQEPKLYNYNKIHYYVVVLDDKIVGCGGFGEKDDTNVITLCWGLVDSAFHKQGFGEKLLTYRLEQIKKMYPGAPVAIDTTQYSYPFFEKFGFVTTKITNDYYEVGMHRYDMVFEK